jgi:hypothetical protein
MPYSPVAIPGFGGLVLYPDPQEVGTQNAVDMLNVDLDRRGRVRSRDGFDNLTASAAADRLESITPFYLVDGTRQVVVSSNDGSFYRAYDTAGATIATQSLGGGDVIDADFARFGGPSAEVIYTASWLNEPTQTNAAHKWNGTAWATAPGLRIGGAGAYPYAVEVKAGDNRLVGAYPQSNSSRVAFSDAGTPETIGANN